MAFAENLEVNWDVDLQDMWIVWYWDSWGQETWAVAPVLPFMKCVIWAWSQGHCGPQIVQLLNKGIL